jgi:TrmH RNA methyltransferase
MKKPRPENSSAKTATPGRESSEMGYYGRHACRAVYDHRPDAIIRAYLTNERLGEWSFLMKFCAEKKLAYHVVTDAELEKITGSVHHEGVSILARRINALTQTSLEAQMQRVEKACYLYLDGVGNPHNIGALLRSAAHFGLSAIVALKKEMPQLNPSGCRIAEGGAEFVPLAFLEDRKAFFHAARKSGFRIFGTSSHKGTDLFKTKLPQKAIIVLGAEVEGMQPVTGQECDEMISIKGTGHVESLNVSVAGALLMAEFFRSQSR